MSAVYLLMSQVDYEGSSPVLAFNSESDAKVWREKASKWISNKPTLIDDSEAGWDSYDAEYAAWSKSIPELSGDTIADSFYVTSIEIK